MKKSCELLDHCAFILNFKSKRITELESRINAEMYPRNSAQPLIQGRVSIPYIHKNASYLFRRSGRYYHYKYNELKEACKLKKTQAEKPFSILYVEDEHLTRCMVATVLSRRYPDVHIDTADNGAAGLARFMKFHHDLIITDNRMPHMSGLQMVSAIRAISPCVPVIFLTASIPENGLQDILPREWTFLLLKPYPPHELFSLIDRYTKLL